MLVSKPLTRREVSGAQGVAVNLRQSLLDEVHDVSLGVKVQSSDAGDDVFIWFALNSQAEKENNHLGGREGERKGGRKKG